MKEQTKKMLKNYCLLMNVNEEDAVDAAVREYTRPYQPVNGKLIPGLYLEKKEHLGVLRPCTILGKFDQYGGTYYRIVLDGKLLEVPEERIRKKNGNTFTEFSTGE